MRKSNIETPGQTEQFTIHDLIRCVTQIVRQERHLKRILVEEYTEGTSISFRMFTSFHSYSVYAGENDSGGYLGCIMNNRMPEPGEKHTRGCDLWDGKLTHETWVNILSDIVNMEILNIEESALRILFKDYPAHTIPRVLFKDIAMKHARDIIIATHGPHGAA